MANQNLNAVEKQIFRSHPTRRRTAVKEGYESLSKGPVSFQNWCIFYEITVQDGLKYLSQRNLGCFTKAIYCQFQLHF